MRKLNLLAIVIAASFGFIESAFCQSPKVIDTPSQLFRGIGLENLPQALAWIRRLDTEWQEIVKGETRMQRLRQVKQIAITTKALQLDCMTAESSVRRGVDVTPAIEDLKKTVSRLRGEMMSLSTDLGAQLGKDGLAIAEEFANFTVLRGLAINEASVRLKNEDRLAAAEYLNKAAKIAGQAHDALVLFILKNNNER